MADSFDYIIVGAGTAGCVLAERLSADGRSQVLLLEDGPADDSWLLRMPKGFGQVLDRQRYAATFPAVRGHGLADEIWLRGSTLGGSSSVNGMTWVRCQREDFEALGDANPGWSWADMQPYFDRLDGGGNGTGIVKVKRHPDPGPAADAFIATARKVGVPDNADINGPMQEGVGTMPTNIDARGRRSSASTAFLAPARRRPNLRIETGVKIDRIALEEGKARFVHGMRGGEHIAFAARGEIVLSAGGIGSPMILERSGIGEPELLQSIGIPVAHALSGVGRNVSEHLLLSINFRVRSWRFSQNRDYAGWRLLRNVGQYMLSGSGPMAQPPYHAVAFARSHADLNRPDLQIMFAPWSRTGRTFDPFPGINIFGYQLRPESRGDLHISSPDPAAAPVIRPNYLSSPADQASAVTIVRWIRALAKREPLAGLIAGETGPTVGCETDEAVLAAFRKHARTGCHAAGTCSMGSGSEAVVDARTRVHGVGGLRVVDASIYPFMLSGNLNAPTHAVAMRAADLILEDRR